MSIITDLISPIKGYLVAGVAVLAISLFTYWSLHERSVEHAKDVAVATKEVAKVEKKDAAITATATAEVQHDQIVFKQVVAMPDVGDIGVVCKSAGGDTVPSAAAGNDGGHPATDSGAGVVFDPSGSILTVGRKYDAWVRSLQSENAALRKELEAAHR